jgi:hypothetical protein
MIKYADAPTRVPTPVEFVDSARVPSVGFQCANVMDDPPVHNTVVKLTAVTPKASSGAVIFDPSDIPPPCDAPPILPPAEPPPINVLADIVMDGNLAPPNCFSVGSMVDDTDMAHPPSPTTPFEFPFDPMVDQYFASVLAGLPDIPSTMDSVTRVISSPRVCGLNGDTRSTIRALRHGSGRPFSLMVDGGANICLTGLLSLLVDTVSIPPMPISVAIEGAGASMADCCTKRGLLPLQLADGGVYYQPCYYCENAVETNLASSPT